MSAGSRESGPSRGDDLFDLPSEAPAPREIASTPSSAAGMDLDKPSSALPRRVQSTSPAGPPLTSVPATPSGIQEQVRTRPIAAAPVAPVVVPATSKLPQITPLTAMWIAFGAFALVTGWGLGSIVVQRGAASKAVVEPAAAKQTEAAVQPAASTPPERVETHASNPTPVVPPTAAPAQPPVPAISDAERLETANASLDAAREDIAAGRRGAARARLARIGLTIDAIQPSARATIRAEAALLLAQCIQADADEAARTR